MGICDRRHEAAAGVEQQPIRRDERAIHPAVAIEVGHVAIVIVFVAVAGRRVRADEAKGVCL